MKAVLINIAIMSGLTLYIYLKWLLLLLVTTPMNRLAWSLHRIKWFRAE